MKKLILTSMLTAVGLLAQSSGNGPIVQPKPNDASATKAPAKATKTKTHTKKTKMHHKKKKVSKASSVAATTPASSGTLSAQS
jgi:hypothetical protein